MVALLYRRGSVNKMTAINRFNYSEISLYFVNKQINKFTRLSSRKLPYISKDNFFNDIIFTKLSRNTFPQSEDRMYLKTANEKQKLRNSWHSTSNHVIQCIPLLQYKYSIMEACERLPWQQIFNKAGFSLSRQLNISFLNLNFNLFSIIPFPTLVDSSLNKLYLILETVILIRCFQLPCI